MRCVECGHEIKDGAVFCIRCGAMQVSDKSSSAGASTKPSVANTANVRKAKTFEPTPKRGGGGIVVFVIAAIAVLAAIVALAMFALNPGSSGDASSAGKAITVNNSQSSSASESSASSSASSSAASKSSSSAASKSASASSASAQSGAAAATTTTSNNNGNNGATQNENGQAGGTGVAGQAANQGDQNQANQGTATAQQQDGGYQQDANQQQAPAPEPQPAPEPEPEPEPAPAATGTDGSYMLADTSSRVYSKDELSSMSSYDLWIARNEIFARHGRKFQDPDLQAYFSSKSWYSPQYSAEEFDTSQSVSDIESQNAALMLEIEQERNSPYL